MKSKIHGATVTEASLLVGVLAWPHLEDRTKPESMRFLTTGQRVRVLHAGARPGSVVVETVDGRRWVVPVGFVSELQRGGSA